MSSSSAQNCMKEGCGRGSSSSSKLHSGGAARAASLLRSGKLRTSIKESLVIEQLDEEDTRWQEAGLVAGRREYSVARVWPEPRQGGGEREEPKAREAGESIVEEDLCIQDWDSEEEALPPQTLLASAPSATEPRRRMKARAQSCMVCMEEKEHTFVPPHVEKVDGQHVMGHRFCTDCWVEFLYHSLRPQRGRNGQLVAVPLACPLCRSAISVPDVWAVDFELPACWRLPAAGAEERCCGSPLSQCPVSTSPLGSAANLCTWADAAPSTTSSSRSISFSSSNDAPSAEVVEERTMLQRLGAPSATVGSRSGAVVSTAAASPWGALRCPVPAWQAGCLRRLCEALSGSSSSSRMELQDESPSNRSHTQLRT